MNLLSAKNVFSDIFNWFANLSSKLPAIDYKTYFIVVVALILGVGLVVAFTYFGSYRFKLLIACKKIIGYLANVEAIDNDNFGDFTSQCFSEKVPSTLRDCWVQYLGVRFGYPSDILSEQNVYDKEVKRVREIRANVFIAVALVLIAIFSFWGYGRLDGKDMGVIFLASLLLSGVIYLVLVIINRVLSNKCLEVFNVMQEDLDAKVVFQVEKSFATDASPLGDLAAIIDEIVARNTAKEIGFEFGDEQTPIEELIAEADDGKTSASADGGKDNKPADGGVEKDAEPAAEPPVDDIDDIWAQTKHEEETENASAVDENADKAPENENTVDEVIEQQADPTVEDTNAQDNGVEQEPVTADEPIVVDEPVKVEEAENGEEPAVENEPSTEAESKNEDEIFVDAEPIIEEEPVVEEEPIVDDGAIDGIVEDVKTEGEPEQKEEQTADVIGDPVEIIVEKESEVQEEKASDDGAQKKSINDNDQKVEDEQVEDEQAVEASSDVNEQEPQEEPVPETVVQPDEQSVSEEQVIAEELKEEPIKEEPAEEVPAVEEEPVAEEIAQDAEPVAEEPAPEIEKEDKPEPQREEPKAEKKVKSEGGDSADDDEPIIQYVMDGPMDDDDEIVKPAQLVKMPNLVDYMIEHNASPKIKMNIVNKLIASYKKFEDSEEDKQIITDCIKKLMADLQGKK